MRISQNNKWKQYNTTIVTAAILTNCKLRNNIINDSIFSSESYKDLVINCQCNHTIVF